MSTDNTEHQTSDPRTSLSALMDGEVSELELHRLLREARDNPELLDSWQRYHLARSALRGEPFQWGGSELSERIAARIADEPTPGSAARSGGWLSRTAVPMGKLAVAASVAAAVFLGLQTLSSERTDTPSSDTWQTASNDADGGTGNSSVDPEAQQRLNEYIQSVSIPYREDGQGDEQELADINELFESTPLRPVSDRELLPSDEKNRDDSN